MDELIPIFVLFVTPVSLALLFIGYRLANRMLDLRMAKLTGGIEADPLASSEPRSLDPQPLQEHAHRLQERLKNLEEILAHPTKEGNV